MNAVTLEMSFKPFKQNSKECYESVCEQIFSQWAPLTKRFNEIDILFWIGDGSEILEYTGNGDQHLEWARYIGRANEFDGDWNPKTDPLKLSPHATRYLYMENPPEFTYHDMSTIISMVKEVGERISGKKIRVGATFDPGPEFAVSNFKYVLHPEICTAGSMGSKSFVVSYEKLHADKNHYKAYPNGIPEGTPFATFLGKQSQVFLTDFQFDYIWFSNGFGFGAENWNTTGPLFDGKQFLNDPKKVEDLKQKTHQFWELFRKECPRFEVQTRGTNLSVGIDFATDAVAAEEIYSNDFNIVPPPNSPWAALDKNFGLELAGYLSRIADLPKEKGFMYRFYLRDPWWLNSPWFDRYEGEPHDIYLPLSMSRLAKDLSVQVPEYVNYLTIDDSWGNTEDDGALFAMTHTNKALDVLPDEAAPLVWIYPFKEYQNIDQVEGKYLLDKSFSEDWYMISAINAGVPLSSVISTSNFVKNTSTIQEELSGSIFVTPVPYANSPFEISVMKMIEQGGKVIFYGSLENASDRFKTFLGVKTSSDGLSGELMFHQKMLHTFESESYPALVKHDELLSDGKNSVELAASASEVEVLSAVSNGVTEKIDSLFNSEKQVGWVRGINSNTYSSNSSLLQPVNRSDYFPTENQLRYLLEKFGYHIEFTRKDDQSRLPALSIHRHNNAFHFSCYSPDTSVEMKIKLPLGVPVWLGQEVHIENGFGNYSMLRSNHTECRVFVQQKAGVVSMTEYGPVSIIMKRRMLLDGLREATVYVFPEKGKEEKCELLLNSIKPNSIGEDFDYQLVTTPWGKAYKAKNITGHLMCSFEYDGVNYLENKGVYDNAGSC